MPKIRVHELASKLGRSNREVIEFLKANGVEVKSHMSTLEEPSIRLIKQKFFEFYYSWNLLYDFCKGRCR